MSFQHTIATFLEGTSSVQILSDSLHAPIHGCTLAIEDNRLVIRPHILFDNYEDELLLTNLEVIEFHDSTMIVLKVHSTSDLQTLTIVKEM